MSHGFDKLKGAVGDKLNNYSSIIVIILPCTKKEVLYDLKKKRAIIDGKFTWQEIFELEMMVSDLISHNPGNFLKVKGRQLIHDDPYVK